MIMLQEFNTENLAKKIKKVSGKELHYSLFTNEVDTHIMLDPTYHGDDRKEQIKIIFDSYRQISLLNKVG